ncbi:MAG: pyruvate, phosphate dikinase [Candidatus Parcubacteria bacterium]|nr:pyruvate, phosphate dikinase [Candidatus Parcubacteria bacterium]
MAKNVFSFYEGDGKNKMLLGGKGANLCEMTQIGLNIPPGFVISTEACLNYLEDETAKLPRSLKSEIAVHIKELERQTEKQFGGALNPLLVSVRSGSAMSMPGMMDTILNLGLNETTIVGLIERTGNPRFAWDAYRRFVQLFGKVALGVPDEKFDDVFDEIKRRVGAEKDVDLTAENLTEATYRFLEVVKSHTGKPFPHDPREQLEIAILAVFRSWNGKRAHDYRRQFKITKDMANGTAVNVVTMVFGNMGDDSATGVGFTRDPGTGINEMYGEYLVNAQGEDVVAGTRTPKPVKEMATEMPDIYRQLAELRNKLEAHYHEVQDYEYTIEKGVLYCLQTRNGKMNTVAQVRTSVEMAKEGLITKKQAVLRIKPDDLTQLLSPQLDKRYGGDPIAIGLSASPGASSGQIVFDADEAEKWRDMGRKVILVREETKPEDIHGFFASVGILTSRGGKTSHAAVVARGMGKPCVAGAEGIKVDVRGKTADVGEYKLYEGDVITIDGGTGKVYLGEIPVVPPEFSEDLKTLLSWADRFATLKVRANADTPDGAKKAREYGATGIGLVRTERMFNDTDRLPIMVDMIVSDSPKERAESLKKLADMQRKDFKQIFLAMAPLPVTVRLLDPPLHEFLPTELELLDKIQEAKHGASLSFARNKKLLAAVRALRETNPMLGHRGVRLGLTNPEIYNMQLRAILEAAADCEEEGTTIVPEIMIPQVISAQEIKPMLVSVKEIAEEIEMKRGITVKFAFGTMMETVRACLRADELAKTAEFFSFGTNDLSQATFSFSREDAENKFLPFYNEHGILVHNPFEILDVNGVGKLMKMAIEDGRKTRPELKVGICGEHGGEPRSIAFCHSIGLSYVSCSPLRIPVARLAAAHAALNDKKTK